MPFCPNRKDNMKKLGIIIPLLLLAALPLAVFAGGKQVAIAFATNQNSSNLTATVSDFRGEIREVLIDVSGSGVYTGAVSLIASGPVAGIADRTILTTNVSADQIVRPRFNGHDGNGVALTGDATANEPFYAYGETLKVAVTNIGSVITGSTWTVFIKYKGE